MALWRGTVDDLCINRIWKKHNSSNNQHLSIQQLYTKHIYTTNVFFMAGPAQTACLFKTVHWNYTLASYDVEELSASSQSRSTKEGSATRWSSDMPSSEMSSSYDVIRLDSRLPTTIGVIYKVSIELGHVWVVNSRWTSLLLQITAQKSIMLNCRRQTWTSCCNTPTALYTKMLGVVN